MKVLIVCHANALLAKGGIGPNIKNLSEPLKQEPDIGYFFKGQNKTEALIDYCLSFRRFKRFFKSGNSADIIHFCNLAPSFLNLPMTFLIFKGRDCSKRLIFTPHAFPFETNRRHFPSFSFFYALTKHVLEKSNKSHFPICM